MRILSFAVVLFCSTIARAAPETWFDAKMGCGRAATFAKTGKMEDLPGCSGKLPKDAPKVETVLGEAKRQLIEADEMVGKGKLEKVDALIASVETALKQVPPINKDIPDRWEQSITSYRDGIVSLRNRQKLASHVDKVRSTHHAAVEAGAKDKISAEGGAAGALKAAEACAAAFAEVRKANIDMATEIELGKERRRLDQLSAECEQVAKSATETIHTQEKAAKAMRAEWRKLLKGDRLKAFDAHPNALPDFDGKDKDWRLVVTVQTWRYKTDSGTETVTFSDKKPAGKKTAKHGRKKR